MEIGIVVQRTTVMEPQGGRDRGLLGVNVPQGIGPQRGPVARGDEGRVSASEARVTEPGSGFMPLRGPGPKGGRFAPTLGLHDERPLGVGDSLTGYDLPPARIKMHSHCQSLIAEYVNIACR